ncbi:BON domain-containing protein [Aquicella lusitana]|uniref:Osmotically-inducible protein OsmY n=1 Tax=Aquicella lusitana TaxID=254246 RepID=A0A370GMY3_9COXI|nr:BON domain-containing protein [Aquicella lusitana]RDI44760.1 osmotically-inducible protein OsmY [Aquicella lusitana]VVC72957.1 Osmotically-inducible protein Y [Aquicella lusitana]
MKKFMAIIVLAFSLQGCIFVAGAAAGAAAIAIVYDHRTIENTLQDTRIANKIADKINKVPALRDESHIEVTVFNRVVLLTGETPNPAWRQQAEDIAKSDPEISRVYNQITIQGPTSTLTRTSDSWITTKIKGQMLATEDLKSSSIKVVTENGVVYLMGIVNRQQADIAVDIARQVSGVQKVVKIFQYRT